TTSPPRRIKAAHRRRRRSASGQSVQRYYDPAIGRFLSVDPVGPLDNPINHFGRYHYANNNPYSFVDPDGRCGTRIQGASAVYCSSFKLAPDAGNQEPQGGGQQRTGSTSSAVSSTQLEPRIPLATNGGELMANTLERIRRRTSFVASGGVALGSGLELEAQKHLAEWEPDKIGAYKVMGLGAFYGASVRFKVFEWGGEPVSGVRTRVNPLGFFKAKLGAVLSFGVSTKWHENGGSFSLNLGLGSGGQVVYKDPATVGWEKEL
uniref:RHS repeat-associated core domain-containing protein n=1 Tax=Silanimonas sp. TaxID=1929290 RepID=UPI0037C6041E